MVFQEILSIRTKGRSTVNVSGDVQSVIQQSGIVSGICQIFIQHTSASLMLCENADPTVRKDLETFMSRLVPDGDPMFQHDAEGPDDMPAHIRTLLTNDSLSLPVNQGRAALGTWQGIFVWEHRIHPHTRRILITVMGE